MTPEHIEQKRADYLRQAKAHDTLDRLERGSPTRWHHRLDFGWMVAAVVGLPAAIAWTLYAAFGG